LFSLKNSGYYKYANGTRQKVEKKNDCHIRLRKTPIEFTQLELQTTVNKNYKSSMDLQFV
jgi:hypothetical protein